MDWRRAADAGRPHEGRGRWPLLLSVLLSALSAGPSAGSDFTVVVLPDTQFYAQSFPQIFDAQLQWIADQKDARNIVYVAQLGDCVEEGDNGGDPSEWLVADAAFGLIEDPVATALPDGIPYGIAVGNHDQSPFGDAGPGTTLFYNQFFGESRFLGRAYYGGHFGTDNDNHVDFFSASGMDFVVVYMEYDTNPDAAVLAWADGLLATHSDKRAIVVSHYLINNSGDFGNQGQEIYDALKSRPNLFLMLGGHRSGEAVRMDVFAGSTVRTVLSNYQNRSQGGEGWLRIMEFSPANDEIRVSTYSPWLQAFETDASSQFTLAYDLDEPLCLDDAECDDGLFCNGAETCDPQLGCQAGTPPALDEGVVCTEDTCDEVADLVVHTPNDALCDDGLFCNGAETCDAVSDCQAGTPPVLDDGVVCTEDTCDEVADLVVHTPNDALCDDGDPCTAESCDAITGCASVPIANCPAPVPTLPPWAWGALALSIGSSGALLIGRRRPVRPAAARRR
jgi:hypothetical protein